MRPLEIVHVVGCMRRAGIETWLMNVVRRMDPARYRFTFLVHTTTAADYDAELLALGCRIIRLGTAKRNPAYASSLASALRHAGPFDILHCHEHHLSGVILAVADSLSIPIRIAHCHNDTAHRDRLPHLARYLVRAVARRLIHRHATHGLSCGERAAPSLFGRDWRQDPRIRVLPYGFDFAPFAHAPKDLSLRQSLGIPPNRWVVGHVGRLEPQKNHAFLLEIASHLRDTCPPCHFLFVGDGTQRGHIEAAIRSYGLQNHITMLASRPDVPALLVNAIDCFLFPSLHEGLPLALIEAQAAALPCVFSDTITGEANLFPATNHVLPLSLPAAGWAAHVRQWIGAPVPTGRRQRVAELLRTPLAIGESVRRLESLYGEAYTLVS